VVSYKSPTIDTTLRTFEIKCVLPLSGKNEVPGALADITVLLESRPGVGVPTKAIQLRGGRPVVFVVEGNVARMVPVEPGIDTDGWTELAGNNLEAGAPVVSMGQFLLNDGTPVNVQQREAR